MTTWADLNCFDFLCFPIVGLPNRWVTDCFVICPSRSWRWRSACRERICWTDCGRPPWSMASLFRCGGFSSQGKGGSPRAPRAHVGELRAGLLPPALLVEQRLRGGSRSISEIPGKDFTDRNERNSEVPGKTRQSEWRGTCGANSWGREGSITHETPIRFVGLAARVHRLRSGRLCGGCRASSRRSRCPSAVRLDRSRPLRGRVLPRLSRAWVLRASSTSLAVVAASSVGRSSHGGARSPGRRRFFPINPLCP